MTSVSSANRSAVSAGSFAPYGCSLRPTVPPSFEPSPHRSEQLLLAMESAATPYPVVFFDGEHEHENGFISIHSGLTFKRFRSLLSQRTGVPATHLSVAFIFPGVQKGIEKRQRLPINGNTNFSILLKQHNPSKERDCCFIVALRKSQVDRRGCRKRGTKDGWDHRPAMDDVLFTEARSHVGNESHGEERPQDPTSRSSYAVDAPCIPAPFNARFLEDLPQYRPMQVNGTLGDRGFGRSMHDQQSVPSMHTRRWTYTDQPVPMQGYMLSPRFAAVRKEDNDGFEWYLQDNFFVENNREFNLQGPPAPLFNSYLVCERDASECQHLGMHKIKDSFAQGPGWGAHDSDRVLTLSASKAGPRSSRITALPDFLNPQPNLQRTLVCPSEAQHERSCQVCSDCKNKNIFPVPFHWCVEDTVIKGFRGPSPAGPIGRPKVIDAA